MKLYRKADFVILPLAVALVLASRWVMTRPTISDCPTITSGDYDPLALLKCANRLIELGEPGAYSLLVSHASQLGVTPMDERVAPPMPGPLSTVDGDAARTTTLWGSQHSVQVHVRLGLA